MVHLRNFCIFNNSRWPLYNSEMMLNFILMNHPNKTISLIRDISYAVFVATLVIPVAVLSLAEFLIEQEFEARRKKNRR